MAKKSAGSLEPTNAGKGKWWETIDAASLSELQLLAKDIDKTIDTTVKHVARGKIKVGKLLLEARALFIDDQGFGQWRRENTMIQSKQHAHYLMKVADRFGNSTKLIDGANYSVIQELVLADQKDIEWIEGKIESGEPLPTVQEVREKVKQSKGTSMKGKTLKVMPVSSPHVAINLIVQMKLTMRIKTVVKRGIKGIEGDLIILGMDPDPQCPCHPDNLQMIREHWLSQAENNHEHKTVLDSYGRVAEDFRNWD